VNANGSSAASNSITVATVPVAVAQLTSGIASSPLQAGATAQALLGFSLTSDGPQTMKSVSIVFSGTQTSAFVSSLNLKLIKSGDNDFSTAGDNTVVNATFSYINADFLFTFSNMTESINGTVNYFVTIDVPPNQTTASSNLSFSILGSSYVTIISGAATGGFSGTTYSFTQSNLSDIIANGGNSSAIDYKNFQAASGLTISNSVSLGTFVIRDGGVNANDLDNLSTEITSITFQFTNPTTLRRVALFDGATNIAEAAASGSVNFSSLNLIAPDNSTKSFSLYATFQTTVPDHQDITATITSVPNFIGIAGSGIGSGFAAADGGGASSSNQISVVATKAIFTTQPPSLMVADSIPTTPINIVVQAQDVNGNLDLDYASAATVSNTTSTGMANTPITFNAGVLSFPANFNFTSDAASTTLTVQSGSLTSATSSSILVRAAKPQTPASTIVFSAQTNKSITMSFTSGSGSSRVVVMRADGAVNASPTNGIAYTANSAFGALASEIGSGNYAVGTQSPITITNLSDGTIYYFAVFEFNGSGITTNYLVTNAPTANHSTTSGSGGPTPVSLPLTTGGTEETYSMFSIPVNVPDKTIKTIFEQTLGAQSNDKWRLLQWSSDQKKYIGYTSVSGSALTSIERSNGYWFNTTITPIDIQVKDYTDYTDVSFPLVLKPGWNQISSPYNFDVSWSDVKNTNSSVSGASNVESNLYKFDASTVGFKSTNSLRAWYGNFVFNGNTSQTTFTVPISSLHAPAGGREGSNHTNQDLSYSDWQLSLKLSVGSFVNDYIGFGMHPDAKTSYDSYDGMTVPRFLKYLELNSYHPEFFEPNFARDVVVTARNYNWHFMAESNLSSKEATLSWDKDALGTGEPVLLLFDQATGAMLDMKQTDHYNFELNERHGLHFFYASSKEYLKPDVTSLADVYPNPVSTTVTFPFFTAENGNVQIEV
ncbi:MAG TPA: hypothetical protein DGG95_12165, partial [Cytophagales bacterium]|nr:hypothetical protein [Cytophagales bacterium]